MFRRSLAKPLAVSFAFLVGFAVSFTGMAKPEAVAGQLNYSLGKQDSPLEVYFFSDWLCPICVKVEPVIETAYPSLSQKAKMNFVDKIIHPESVNFVPYHLSFLANEKGKYLVLRKTLFGVAQKTKNPSFDDIKAAIAPLGVTYKQLSFMDVTQQMNTAQKLAEQFKVTATPTLVIRNTKTGKVKTLVGNSDITAEKLAKAIKELE
jgi:protein-disulfide isomerase